MPMPWCRERVPRVAVAGHQAGREGGGPEPVARRDVADAGVGRVQARVQAAHEQPHARRRRCRAACGPRGARRVKPRSPPAGALVELVEREAGAVRRRRAAARRSTSRTSGREVVVREDASALDVAAEQGELDGCTQARAIGAGRRAPAARRPRAGGRRCCGPTPPPSAPRRNGRAREVGLHAEARRAPPRACAAPWPRQRRGRRPGARAAVVYQPGPAAEVDRDARPAVAAPKALGAPPVLAARRRAS